MLAQVWGPLVWRVLEGVANHGAGLKVQPPSTKHAFAQAVQLLPSVMPCSVCRDEFAALLRASNGSSDMQHPPPEKPKPGNTAAVTAAWEAWDPAVWLYLLHAHVQCSVTRRRVLAYFEQHPGEKEAVVKVPSAMAADFIVAASTQAITLDTVRLRVQLADGHYFSVHDLWVMLALFCGACAVLGDAEDSDTASSAAEVATRAANVCAFTQNLAQVLADIGLHRGVARPLAAKMCKIREGASGGSGFREAAKFATHDAPVHRQVVSKLCAAFGRKEREALTMAHAAMVHHD
jgi:hypothetical protein